MGGGNPGQQESQIAQQDQNGANSIAAEMGPLVAGLTGGINMPGINSQVFSYLLNPQNTNLAQMYPQLQGYFRNMMMNGLDPRVTGAALGNFQTGAQQQINSMTNQLGAGLPNLAGSIGDMNLGAAQGRAALGAQLGAENQQMMTQGATGLGNLATGLDSQKMQMLMGALGGAQGAEGMALGAYGNMFGNYLNAANQAAGMAGQLQASQPNIFSSLLGGAMGFGEMFGSGGMFPGAFPGLSGGLSAGKQSISPWDLSGFVY